MSFKKFFPTAQNLVIFWCVSIGNFASILGGKIELPLGAPYTFNFHIDVFGSAQG